MNEQDKKRISKFLSLVLRHQPDYINLKLDANGWADIESLIIKAKTKNIELSLSELKNIVETNDKQRFAFNNDITKIRANQGHSIKTINLQLDAVEPPEILYHGTVAKFLSAIQENGLQKRSRQHVHLSTDIETATKVANRRGKAVILNIKAKAMFKNGYKFYRSENGVWLTNNVPSEFIKFN